MRNDITVVIAGDSNFKPYVEQGIRWTEKLGYPILAYDLGNLGFGKSFIGRVSDEVNAKIPCKPHIIADALKSIKDGEYLVWLDADALIYQNIDEIAQDYDIGVTVRAPKAKEHEYPVNAGIVFVKKTEASINFVERWKELSDKGISDQPPLNDLCKVTTQDRDKIVERNGVRIKVFKCEVYNNFYKQGKTADTVRPVGVKIVHYKSKLRHLYPLGK